MTSSLTQSELRAWLISWVVDNVSSVSSADEVDPDRPLSELGMSSRDAVSLAGELEDLLDVTIAPTLVWQVPTVNGIVAALLGESEPAAKADTDLASQSNAHISAEPDVESNPLSGKGGAGDKNDLIAVIGLGCRFPGGVTGPESFWELLAQGRDAIGAVPAGRWESFGQNTAAQEEVLAAIPQGGGFLDDVAGFDAEFFGISPREAALMDPQQRLLLEVAWEALEHAGIVPDSLRGSSTGVFVGISSVEYSQLTMGQLDSVEAWASTGSAMSIAANRISYLLDLRGPSMAIDTACSSSLMAIHQASRSIRDGESEVALVGGVNLLLGPAISQTFNLAGALSTNGRCEPFSADATGMLRGEGCGVIVLKRLDAAHRDGDRVLAVVRGSAANSDGRSNGLTAPSPGAQEAVLRAAYAKSGIHPNEVDYVEAHGTGTPLGDPIEAMALGAVLGHGRAPERPLHIGSVKSNIGHLEAAAGIAGVIKAVLSLSHGQIPPSLHASTLNPNIDFDAARLHVVSEAIDLPRYREGAIVGVSGFGFGGTNVHVVIGEDSGGAAAELSAPAEAAAERDDAVVLTLSATSPQRLVGAAHRFAMWLNQSEESLHDIASATQRHRGHGNYRAAFVGRDRETLFDALCSAGSDDARVLTGHTRRGEQPQPVWVFSGYGSQWTGMGATLLAEEPVFAEAMAEVAELVFAECGIRVLDLLTSPQMPTSVVDSQIAIFAMQIGLAALWRHRGCEPAAVIGNSMGEVAAAVVAGALSLADGVKVLYTRSQLLATINAANEGGMAVFSISRQEFEQWAPEYPGVSVAVYTAPTQCTIVGPTDSLTRFSEYLESIGRNVWPMKVAGAPHSPQIEPILGELAARIATITPQEPQIKMYSTVYGEHRPDLVLGPDYWVSNVRQPVRFAQGIEALAADGFRTFIEVSAHPIAVPAINETLQAEGIAAPLVVGTLRRGKDDAVTFASNVATLVVNGVSLRLSSRPDGRFVDLPRQHWNHQQLWVDSSRSVATHGHPLLGEHVELPDGTHHLWSRVAGQDILHSDSTNAHFGAPVISASYYYKFCVAVGQQRLGVPTDQVVVTDLAVHHRLVVSPATQLVTSFDTTTQRIEIHARERNGDVATLCATARISAGSTDADGSASVVELDAQSINRVDLQAPAQLLPHHLTFDASDIPVLTPWGAETVQRATTGRGTSRDAVSPDSAYLVVGDHNDPFVGSVIHWLSAIGSPAHAARVICVSNAADLAAAVDSASADGFVLRGVIATNPVAAEGLAKVCPLEELDWFVSLGDLAGLAGIDDTAFAVQQQMLNHVAEVRDRGGRAYHVSLGCEPDVSHEDVRSLVGSMTPAELPSVLEVLLDAAPSDAVATLIDRQDIAARKDEVANLPLLAGLLDDDEVTADSAQWGDVDALRAAGPALAPVLLLRRVRERLAGLMGANARDLDIERPLIDSGVDSLIATRARNSIEQELGVEMQIRVVLQGAGVRTLTLHLCELLDLDAASIATAEKAAQALAQGGADGENGMTTYLAPRDPAERFIALIWREVLGREAIGVNDDFFAVGGDKEGAEAVTRLAAQRLNIALVTEQLFSLPTIAAMSDVIRPQLEGNSGSLVRVLNPGYASSSAESTTTTRPPLFVFHPAGGPTTVYQPLVSLLDLEQPVYGFERIDDLDSVEERVEAYLPLLREIAPHGPYRLIGWSFGGILAHEMGRRLMELGEEVELVAMIDTRIPKGDPDADPVQLLMDRFRAFEEHIYQTYQTRLEIPYDALSSMSNSEQLATFLEILSSSGLDMPPAIVTHQYTSYADTRLAEMYVPQGKYEGLSLLYHASPDPVAAKLDPRYGRNDETLGWDELCSDLQIVYVPGDHISVIDRPNVDVLAQHLNDFLAALAVSAAGNPAASSS